MAKPLNYDKELRKLTLHQLLLNSICAKETPNARPLDILDADSGRKPVGANHSRV